MRTEPGEIHEKYWERMQIAAFKNDPFRIAIELIKNSADSYTRLSKNKGQEPPFEIFMEFFYRKNKPPRISVLDYGEGMNSKKLKEALKYGTQTSMGEDTEAVTSAEKGIGLKDAMLALEDNWLVTIKDGFINERNKHRDFTTGFGKEDEKVTEDQRKNIQIPANGTLVTGKLPEYFSTRKTETIIKCLQQHFLMRKILQNSNFKIYVIDGWTKKKLQLKYQLPRIEREALRESFSIKYKRQEFNIDILINRTSEGLKQGKPFGDSGLLFYYGGYSVVDLTFCHYDKDVAFSKFFGEVQMEIGPLFRDPEEPPLVDEKRRGLDPEHPFNKKLFREINKRLVNVQEKEEESKYTFDEKSLKDALKELNKLYKEIRGRGPQSQPPIKPETFAFYPVYASVMEYEQKTVFLIINSDIIDDRLELSLKSTNPDITLNRKLIKIEEIPSADFIIKQIPIYSEKAGTKGEIIVTSLLPPNLPQEKMGIEVIENPMFSPKNGFAFVPDKTTIIDGGKKKVDLCIDKGMIKGCFDIGFSSSGPIRCPGKFTLPRVYGLEKYIIKNIVKIDVPIETMGKENIGEKAEVNATYKGKLSSLKMTIVPEPSITGLFRGIRPSPKITKKISYFLKNEGILEFYYKHPLIRKYMKKDYMNRPDFLVFVADVLTREAMKAVVISGIEDNLARFMILDMDNPQYEIEEHINREYFEEGPRMHEVFMKLVKDIKL